MSNSWEGMFNPPTIKPEPTLVVVQLESGHANSGGKKERLRLLEERRAVMLQVITDNPGCTAGDIGRVMGMTYASITNDLRMLGKRGLIERTSESVRGVSARYSPK